MQYHQRETKPVSEDLQMTVNHEKFVVGIYNLKPAIKSLSKAPKRSTVTFYDRYLFRVDEKTGIVLVAQITNQKPFTRVPLSIAYDEFKRFEDHIKGYHQMVCRQMAFKNPTLTFSEHDKIQFVAHSTFEYPILDTPSHSKEFFDNVLQNAPVYHTRDGIRSVVLSEMAKFVDTDQLVGSEEFWGISVIVNSFKSQKPSLCVELFASNKFILMKTAFTSSILKRLENSSFTDASEILNAKIHPKVAQMAKQVFSPKSFVRLNFFKDKKTGLTFCSRNDRVELLGPENLYSAKSFDINKTIETVNKNRTKRTCVSYQLHCGFIQHGRDELKQAIASMRKQLSVRGHTIHIYWIFEDGHSYFAYAPVNYTVTPDPEDIVVTQKIHLNASKKNKKQFFLLNAVYLLKIFDAMSIIDVQSVQLDAIDTNNALYFETTDINWKPLEWLLMPCTPDHFFDHKVFASALNLNEELTD